MGTLQPDSDDKGDMDDSGCIQDGSPPVKKQAVEKTETVEMMETLESDCYARAQLLDLSDDVLLYVLQHCTPRDLKALGYTCTRLGALVRDRTLWTRVDARLHPCGRARLRWLLNNVLTDTTTELMLCGYARESRGCLGHVTGELRDDGDKPEGDADNNNVQPSTSAAAAGPSASAGGGASEGAPTNGAAGAAPAEVASTERVSVKKEAAEDASAYNETEQLAPAKDVKEEDASANNVSAELAEAPTEHAIEVDPLADIPPVENPPAVASAAKGAPVNDVPAEREADVDPLAAVDDPMEDGPVERTADVDPLADDVPVVDTPAVAAEGAPAVAAEGAPAVAGQGVPFVAVEGAPAVAGQGVPFVAVEGAPAVAAQGVPFVAVEGAPRGAAGGAPAVVFEGAPAVAAHGVPFVAVEGAPPGAAGGAPAVVVEGAPAVAAVNRNRRAGPPYPLARQHARLHINAQQLPRLCGAPSWFDDYAPEAPALTDGSCPGPQFTVSQHALRDLQLQCSKLTSLTLEHCNINCKNTGINHFPPTLTRLSLRGTKCYNLPVDKSFLFKIQDYMPKLEFLDVSENEWMEPASLLPLSKIANLMTLIMQECSRMTEFVAYASLATRYGFRKLKVLDMRGSPVGDSEVSAFGWVPELEELYLAAAVRPEQPVAEHSHVKGEALPPHEELDQWEIDEEPMYQLMLESSDSSYEEMDEQEEYAAEPCRHDPDFNICNEGVRIEVSLRASNGDGAPEQVRQVERYSVRRRPREGGAGDARADRREPGPAPAHKRRAARAGGDDAHAEKKPRSAEDDAKPDDTDAKVEDAEEPKTPDDAVKSDDKDDDVKKSDEVADEANISDDIEMSDDTKNAKASDDAQTPDGANTPQGSKTPDGANTSGEKSKRKTKRKARYSGNPDKSPARSKRRRQADVNEGASTSRTIDIRFEISREPIDNPADRNAGPSSNNADVSPPNDADKKADSDNSDDEDDGSPKKRNNAVGVAVNASVNSTEQGQVEVQVEIRGQEIEGQGQNQAQGENQAEVRPRQAQDEQAQAPDEQGQAQLQARERRGIFHERRGRRGHSRRRRFENVVRFRQNQDPVIIQCPILPQRPEPEQPENREGEPRHHILYVNVGQQLHAVYRLLPSRPIFHSMRNRNWRPNIRNVFYSPSQPHVDASSLVTDSAIRRFGRADGDQINYVNIGPNGPYPAARDAGGRPVGLLGPRDLGARPDRSNLRILSVTGYRHITDRSLVHLATSAPHLTRIDFSNTGVTERGVENFRNLRPECEITFSAYSPNKKHQGNGGAE